MANPAAEDDSFSIPENGAVSGSVFGNDSDPNSDPFAVTSVNGSAANVGTEITLASGALLTVNADGTVEYDPNGLFDHLPSQFSGAPSSVWLFSETFTYTITDGDTATVTVTIRGVDSDADQFTGTSVAQTLNGGAGLNDRITYAASPAGININLGSGFSGFGGHSQGDRLSAIEHLVGSAFGDNITGNQAGNRIEAGNGNDVAFGVGGDDQIFGEDGNDTLNGGTGTDHLDGGAGNDTLTDSSLGTNVLIGGAGDDVIDSGNGDDLLDGGAGDDIVSGWLGADDIDGGADDDNLRGGDGDDQITGGDGDDIIRGEGGADAMNGGDGIDTLAYYSGVAVTASLATGTGSVGDAAGDTFTGFENIIGSSANDTLTGDSSANVLDGSTGDDTLDGGLGADDLFGSSGVDTVTYASSGVGVNANLTTTIGTGGTAQGDYYRSIENLMGSNFADLLYGNAGVNRLDGGGGDDEIVGGLGGDAFIGGAGIDEVFYANSNAGVIMNMTANTAGGGHATGDTFDGIENVFGSRYADELYGDAGGNKFDGWQGSDVLSGGDGDDWLIGGLGNDDLIGGIGGDVLAGGFGNDNLNGGAGDDVMVGYGGLDIFIYMDAQFGNDTVMGFQNDFDKFDLTGSGLTFADFTETAAGPGTRLTWFDGSVNHTILIIGVAPGLIDAGDFVT